MGIFGSIARAFTGKPPKLYPGEVVRFASVPTPGVIAGSLRQRPYAVRLDADHQEAGDRRWLQRQSFADLDYAGRWAEWVQAQGALPQPDYPAGGSDHLVIGQHPRATRAKAINNGAIIDAARATFARIRQKDFIAPAINWPADRISGWPAASGC